MEDLVNSELASVWNDETPGGDIGDFSLDTLDMGHTQSPSVDMVSTQTSGTVDMGHNQTPGTVDMGHNQPPGTLDMSPTMVTTHPSPVSQQCQQFLHQDNYQQNIQNSERQKLKVSDSCGKMLGISFFSIDIGVERFASFTNPKKYYFCTSGNNFLIIFNILHDFSTDHVK